MVGDLIRLHDNEILCSFYLIKEMTYTLQYAYNYTYNKQYEIKQDISCMFFLFPHGILLFAFIQTVWCIQQCANFHPKQWRQLHEAYLARMMISIERIKYNRQDAKKHLYSHHLLFFISERNSWETNAWLWPQHRWLKLVK